MTTSVVPRVHGERKAKCPECGAEYTQVQIHASWMDMAAKHDPAIREQFPDGWTPDMCPKCCAVVNRAEAQIEHSRRERLEFEARERERAKPLERPRYEKADD